jgi:DNA-binding NtrC family response regulator
MDKNAEILIVDDNTLYSLYLKVKLENRGYENIDIVNGAESVLSHLKEKSYRLIICPSVLPEMLASELMVSIKYQFPEEDPNYLVLVNEKEAVLYEKEVLFGQVFYYTGSPIDLDTFDETIQKMLDNKADVASNT